MENILEEVDELSFPNPNTCNFDLTLEMMRESGQSSINVFSVYDVVAEMHCLVIM